MAYGIGEYGQSGYGGSSVGQEVPYISASTPLEGASGVLATATATVTLTCADGLDINTLSCSVAGSPAIVGGVFLSGYGGSITQDPLSQIVVVLSTHPDFSGAVVIGFTASSLAGITGTPTLNFATTAIVSAAETLVVSEQVDLVQPQATGVSESLAVSDGLGVGILSTLAIAETLTQSEALSMAAALGLSETISQSESLGLGGAYTQPTSDTVTQSAAVALGVLATQPVVDTLTQTDAVNTLLGALVQAPDAVTSSEQVTTSVSSTGLISVSETLGIAEGVLAGSVGTLDLFEALSTTEALGTSSPFATSVSETLQIGEEVSAGSGETTNVGGYAISQSFHIPVQLSRAADLRSYTLTTNGWPVSLESCEPVQAVVASGTNGTVLAATSHQVSLDAALDGTYVGKYLQVTGWSYQIVSVDQNSGPAKVTLTTPVTFDPAHPTFFWDILTGAMGVRLVTSKLANDTSYTVQSSGLLTVAGQDADFISSFVAHGVLRPVVATAEYLPNGTVVVTFGEPMTQDHALTNPGDYTFTGPTSIKVKRVRSLGVSQVALETSGFGPGSYSLQVSTSTPRDLGGNPLSPAGASFTFTADATTLARSVYTDKGPLAKPPLVLQQGSPSQYGMIETATEVMLTGGAFGASVVGKQVILQGTSLNDGAYEILGVVSSSRLVVKASFRLPDPSNGAFTWKVRDPRNGQIADAPQDVVVRVNGAPVTPVAVNGLLGQVVLATQPQSADQVSIDYHWVDNPRVQILGFNRPEFRLNAWNRNRKVNQASGHQYRYNNVLMNPRTASQGLKASLPQPQERDIRYRAYEVAYSALMNKGSRLRFNTPRHKIAYPAASRTLSEIFVPYEASQVPEGDPQNPWIRKGSGTYSVSAGTLTCQDASDTQPLFWTRPLDLSYPHVFAQSWRGSCQALTGDGVWTGSACGYSDPSFGVIFGYLEDGGIRKVGLLLRGGSDPGLITAWESVALDWTVVRTYRVYRNPQGVVGVYVDGSPQPILSLDSTLLPYLADVPAPFDAIQGVWFGNPSRPATVQSFWDFMRYQAIPTNSTQYGYSGIVDYTATVLPEQASKPWTPCGASGTGLLQGSSLLLSNTSALASSDGAMEGDYRAMVRLEPLLGTASTFTVDTYLQGLTSTFGLDPLGLLLAVNDGQRTIQASWVQDAAAAKLSYGGRVLPEQFGAYGWVKSGGAPVRMAGHDLEITDTSLTDGAVYSCDDLAPDMTSFRALSATADYGVSARLRVASYQADALGFAGASFQAFDGLRAVGVMLTFDGSPKVSLSSDGAILAQWIFPWNDQKYHQFTVRKATAADLVSLFCDGVLVGTFPYSGFTAVGPQLEGQLTFGSATPASILAKSVVQWDYCNAWAVSTPRRYWGIWNGGNTHTLLDFHLPVLASGVGSAVGNSLQDPLATLITSGVQAGDVVLVPEGLNKGTYHVGSVLNEQNLTVVEPWPSQIAEFRYLIPAELDWQSPHTYRLARTASGEVQLAVDGTTILGVSYGAGIPVTQGVVGLISGSLPSVLFGSLSGPDLGASKWDYVRYQITRHGSSQTLVPQLQVLNQWNCMASGERLNSQIPHQVTSFRSSSTGIIPRKDPDEMANPAMRGNTILNDGTPIVPIRQAIRNQLEALYTCLDQIPIVTGNTGIIQPFADRVAFGDLQWVKTVCLAYDGSVLPEASGAWQLVSDYPARVSTTVVGGKLLYGTTGPTKTAYLNNTPLLDTPSLTSTVSFKVRVNQDATFGIGDSQVRLGFSAPEMTLALAFVTNPVTLERFVNVLDMQSGAVVGGTNFDFLDGQFHTYQLERDPTLRLVTIRIY